MKTTEEVKQRALVQFEQGDKSTRNALIAIFGKELFPLTGMESIQTFDDASQKVGVTENQQILLNYNGMDKDLLAAKAFLQLTIIARALNDGWEPDWTDSNQYKYYVWLDEFNSGSGFSDSYYVYSHTGTSVGSRLCFKSQDLALYAGEQFRELYNQLFTL